MKDICGIVEVIVNEIWRRYSNLTKGIPPLSIESVPDEAIVFVGINPSLSDQDRKDLEKRKDKTLDLYDLPSRRDEGKTYRYYHKFYDIGSRLNLPIGHVDLLYVRETNQKVVNALLKEEEGIQFVFDQLQVSRQVIDSIIKDKNPQAFVVNNTLARDLLGRYKNKAQYGNDEFHPIVDNSIHWVNYFFEWDDKIGTYVLPYKDRRIPFFFTSMLTGQRALDNGSFERLIWHLDYAIKNSVDI